ncbi:MAG TPA: hypothetical protein VGX03_04515 [Candidatus Binatia bacterium]|jgi:hypothetical protein|nr:hypothetical protein [Candidatus Binatia bacterium]
MNLYWCETADHDEDWFVVASSAKEAGRFHEKEEGYGMRDARATLVCRIPRTLSVRKGWPSHALLSALGAIFLSDSTPRVVEIRSTVYQEGGMDAVINRLSDDYAEATGMGRLNKTTRLQ